MSNLRTIESLYKAARSLRSLDKRRRIQNVMPPRLAEA